MKRKKITQNLSKNTPLILTCSICGQTFLYRGIRDAPYVQGTTFNPKTGVYEPSEADGVICSGCEEKFKGGPLDGLTVGEVISNGRN